MSKPFKFRHSRLIAGSLAIICGSLLAAGLLYKRGTLAGWFGGGKTVLVIAAPPQAPDTPKNERDRNRLQRTLTRFARVEMFGQTIGVVNEVWLGDDRGERYASNPGKECFVVGELVIEKAYAGWIGKSSRVFLREDLGGLGGVYVDITPGEGGDGKLVLKLLPDSSTRSKLEDMAASVEGIIEESCKKLLDKSDELKSSIEGTLNGEGSVGELSNKLTEMTSHVNEFLAKVKADGRNDSLYSMVFTKEEREQYDRLGNSLTDLSDALKDGSIEDRFPDLKKDLRKLVASMDEATRKLSDVTGDTKEAVNSIKETSDRMQRTFLLKNLGTEDKEKKEEDKQAGAAAKDEEPKRRRPIAGPRNR